MGGRVTGVLAGGMLSLLALFALGILHRYLFGPPTMPFGDDAFFREMSVAGLLALSVVRVVSAAIGGWAAARFSGEPQAAWTGPGVVLVSAVVVVAMGMGQPIWSLLVCGLLLLALGWTLSRAAAGLPVIPEGLIPSRER